MMRSFSVFVAFSIFQNILLVNAFSSTSALRRSPYSSVLPNGKSNYMRNISTLKTASTASVTTDVQANNESELETPTTSSNKKSLREIRKEGGITAFNTPLGAINLYGLYHALTSISLGIIWYISIMTWKAFFFLTGGRFDKKRIIPITMSHIWGRLTMILTFQNPTYVNYDILKKIYKEDKNKAYMFVSNHCSWQDIPYVGATIGWRNYKFIAKKELLKVPILGNAMTAGGHVLVDRSSRRSQLLTLKSGIDWLKKGIHLCTFPEGTRSRTGELMPFKNGAFKMAYKANAPVIPLSVCGAHKVQPAHWMFPMKTARDVKVVVHEPVECEGKTEAEVAEIVRERIVEGLPFDQQPVS